MTIQVRQDISVTLNMLQSNLMTSQAHGGRRRLFLVLKPRVVPIG